MVERMWAARARVGQWVGALLLSLLRTPLGRRAFRVWLRINEPRRISVYYFAMYAVLTLTGVYSVWNPPGSLQGEIGEVAMLLLLIVASCSAFCGAVAVLPGRYWLERFAVLGLAFSSVTYLYIVVGLHVTSPGNRLWQAGIIFSFFIMQGVRWERIKDRPYRPESHAAVA